MTSRSEVGLVWMVTHPMSAETLMRGKLRYLSRHGFRVELISAPGSELERAGRREGVPWHAVSIPNQLIEEERDRAIGRIAARLQSIRPTVAIAGTTVMGNLGMLAAREVGVPVRIYQLDGLPLETAEGKAWNVLYEMEALSAAAAHRVFCVSPSLQRRYVELGLDPEGKTRVLGHGSSNGVETRRFRPPWPGERAVLRRRLCLPTRAPIVGWVGRLAEVKGIPDLADAFLGPVLARHPDAFLLLVGDQDPYHPIREELVARLESHPRVRITGHLDDPSPYYRVMDVLAFPSSREGFPGACLEASSSGVPVVGYRVTGVVDAVIEGATGALVDRDDVSALAERICAYLSDAVAGKRDGRRGRQRIVAHFGQQRAWEDLSQGLRAAIAEFASAPASEALKAAGHGSKTLM